jgi:ABC-type oligopeptide transport system ATPase subunit
MLEASHLRKLYVQGRWYSKNKFKVTALDDVSLTIPPNCRFALVGESGAGKSTLGRCLSRLENPDSGDIRFEGSSLLDLNATELRGLRTKIQLIFQDSAAAMNPRFSALEVIEEPLLIQASIPRRARRQLALATMEQVGISPESAERSLLEFSGGQRQRLAIARALVLKPRMLILDEALSSLDFETQEQIVRLLLDLQSSLSLAYLFIAHDLRLAARVADHMAVMQSGSIVESGPVSALFSAPIHPYTRMLLASMPRTCADSSAPISPR